ncbi:MAG: S41 family peptidase [Phycisphaerae bacterium]
MQRRFAVLVALFLCAAPSAWAQRQPVGYYREPALHGDTLVFVAEGDLWRVGVNGGAATRLTSHPGDEANPAFSPDGKTLAFAAEYEGPREIFTMPVSGGLPTRRTFDGARWNVVGWTPDGRIIGANDAYSMLPNWQLFLLDISGSDVAARREPVPLAQAADGCYSDDGKTLFFTRLAFQGSNTKRYKGGTAQNIWRFTATDAEATALTPDYAGTSKEPQWWQGRVYFATDRDGTMNLWSMKPDGTDLRQHTKHNGFDVAAPSLDAGRIAYQLGADLHVYDIGAGTDRVANITLDSDFDQTRENWVKKPIEYMSAAHVSPDGDRVVLTARGVPFVAPHRQGRFVQAARQPGVRYRDVRFLPDGKSLLAMSDESGEVEFWKLPANGVGERTQLTRDGDVLRWSGQPSPDGKWVAHYDKNQRLWLLNVESGENRKVDESPIDDFADLTWSADSRWLAYVKKADNMFQQIMLLNAADRTITPATSDRFDSYAPQFSPDGKWLYLLSDRNLRTIVASPWGNYQPEPFLDKTTRVYLIALSREMTRSPFAAKDELHPDEEKKSDSDKDKEKDKDKKSGDAKGAAASGPADSQPAPAPGSSQPASSPTSQPTSKPAPPEVKIDLAGIQQRLQETPIPAGNYGDLMVNDKAVFLMSSQAGESKRNLIAFPIVNENLESKTVVADVKRAELSSNGKKLLVHKGDSLYIIDAAADEAKLDKKDVDLSAWSLSVTPRDEWRQMFTEAWRLERDYFYDRGMHGVDWKAMLAKYLPLVDRISTRAELSNLIAQMVGELSALHIFVRGGDEREGPINIHVASLGAELQRDPAAGGYRVARIPTLDPDEPNRISPLAKPGVDMMVGDVIELLNGVPTLSTPDLGTLLRNQSGRQVLLRVKPAAGGAARDCIVTPISDGAAADLRYCEWEFSRRQRVEELGGGDIGYVHLRAMGGDNFTEWAKGYFPVFNRKGLIIDVRHNRGGNIDSWILNRLLRKAWFYWSQRVGLAPSWNMQYAFRGHIVVLCNERTASDGEAFSEGFKRLGLGKVIGTRTWGGEIWLSSSNFLVDGGIATAAEFGVFGPEGTWLIEGHGVDPDIVVDNPPHATFKGDDAQLKAAIDYLKKRIADQPIPPVVVPKYPDKSR